MAIPLKNSSTRKLVKDIPESEKPHHSPFNLENKIPGRPVFPSGASSRSKARDYTLLGGSAAINDIVDRHQFGIDKGHARGNWQTGKNDPEFMRDRVNHFFEHALAIVTGIHPRDGRPASYIDIQAALCNLNIIANNAEQGVGLETGFSYLARPTSKEDT